MFTAAVNALCINGLFSGQTIEGMAETEIHASFLRLLEAAQRATAHLPQSRRIADEAGMRKALGITSQAAYNWKHRGISEVIAMRAQRVFGASATWLIDGVGAPVVAGWTPPTADSDLPAPPEPAPATSADVAYVAEAAAKLSPDRMRRLIAAVDMLSGPHGDQIAITFSIAPRDGEPTPSRERSM